MSMTRNSLFWLWSAIYLATALLPACARPRAVSPRVPAAENPAVCTLARLESVLSELEKTDTSIGRSRTTSPYQPLWACIRQPDDDVKERVLEWARIHAPFDENGHAVSSHAWAAWQVLQRLGGLNGLSAKEVISVLGPPTRLGKDGMLEWYEDCGRHINPGIRVWLTNGRVQRVLVEEW